MLLTVEILSIIIRSAHTVIISFVFFSGQILQVGNHLYF